MSNFKILLVEWDLNWKNDLKEKITTALREVGCQDQDYFITIVETYYEAVSALTNSQWNLLITDIAGLLDGDQSDKAQRRLIGKDLITLAHQKQTPTIAISGASGYVTIRHVRDWFKDPIYGLVDFFDKKSFDNNQFIARVKELWQQQNSSIYHIRILNESCVRVKKWNPGQQTPNGAVGSFDKNKLLAAVTPLLENYSNLIDNNSNKIICLGETLFDALFDNDLRQDFLVCYQEIVRQNNQRLKIVLEINESAMPEVVALPWEFMRIPKKYHQGENWFATNSKLTFSRSRYSLLEEKPQYIQLQKEEKLKIALIVAKPTSRTSDADPDLSNVECFQIQNKLSELAHQQRKIELLPVINPAICEKVSLVLGTDQPDIFHFIGHGRLQKENGKEVGEVAFVTDSGEPDWKKADFLSTLFGQHCPSLVILQACNTGKESNLNSFSSVASHLMLQGISLVIAMQYEVSNNTANIFIENFYSEIAKGESVDVAVQQARYKITLKKDYDKPDFATPVIYMNALNARFE
jgi:hypothetical protein